MAAPVTRLGIALLAVAGSLLAGCAREAAAGGVCGGRARTVVSPAAGGGVYLGAFPFLGNSEDVVTGGRIEAFEQLAGRELAWVYVSDNWFGGIRFPARDVATIRRTGAVPFVRMMPRSSWREGVRDARFSLETIVDGRHDAALRAWGREAARVPGPVMVEFAPEPNGDWFPWSGAWDGGPARFRAAYRHVVRVVRAAGARNVTWVWHVDARSDPAVGWNAMRAYWPGAAYVDWIGLSAYGAQSPGDPDEAFEDVFAAGYRDAAALPGRRPIALVEFAVAAAPERDAAAWTREAFDAIESGRYPRLKGVAWWHERWVEDDGTVVDLRVNSSRELLRTFRERVTDTRYVSRVRLACH